MHHGDSDCKYPIPFIVLQLIKLSTWDFWNVVAHCNQMLIQIIKQNQKNT